jgi:hypothetical protein
MKLYIDVDVPPVMAVRTELLAELIGTHQVLSLYKEGKILPGQKRNKSGRDCHPDREVGEDELTKARQDMERELAGFQAVYSKGETK